ncbi:MAG: DUF4145 domain-containing protein [Rhodospirillales bacterium]|nr:DUF4145 domain-containing protein [Rhodospirillales bacterium]
MAPRPDTYTTLKIPPEILPGLLCRLSGGRLCAQWYLTLIMPPPFTRPNTKLNAFNCPRCGAYAAVNWYQVTKSTLLVLGHSARTQKATPADQNLVLGGTGSPEPNYFISTCTHCREPLFWFKDEIIYPQANLVGPAPAEDMPADIAKDYDEARSIAAKSPRGAAALLRLCLQKLCKFLGEKGENINDDIGSLVKKGLAAEVQEALDTLRVFGNNALHPGELDLRDDQAAAEALMGLLNFVVEAMITEPKKRKALFGKVPPGAQKAIFKRDAPKGDANG